MSQAHANHTCPFHWRRALRQLPYDQAARKRTVSLTLNSDLYAKAKAQGINASQVAEAALAEALAARLTEQARAEIGQDLAAYNAYVDRHGSPAEMLRDHLAARDGQPDDPA
ncbi:MAG: type II toxin-antitoxin system CcdA family antitoxin [Reyranella sp.]|nr:type II toxin-antitoxin system CcdA family antitoxin [Reyranella sp.]